MISRLILSHRTFSDRVRVGERGYLVDVGEQNRSIFFRLINKRGNTTFCFFFSSSSSCSFFFVARSTLCVSSRFYFLSLAEETEREREREYACAFARSLPSFLFSFFFLLTQIDSDWAERSHLSFLTRKIRVIHRTRCYVDDDDAWPRLNIRLRRHRRRRRIIILSFPWIERACVCVCENKRTRRRRRRREEEEEEKKTKKKRLKQEQRHHHHLLVIVSF